MAAILPRTGFSGRSHARLTLVSPSPSGERDSQVRQAAADWLCRVLPQAERVRVANAGHLPNLDNPGAYAKVLHRFLGRQSHVAA